MVRKQVQKRLSVVFCKWGSSIFFIYFFFFPLREAGTKLRGAGAGVMARGGVGRGEQRGISPRHLMFILALLLCSPLRVTSICQLQPSITALSPSSSYSLSSWGIALKISLRGYADRRSHKTDSLFHFFFFPYIPQSFRVLQLFSPKPLDGFSLIVLVLWGGFVIRRPSIPSDVGLQRLTVTIISLACLKWAFLLFVLISKERCVP